MLPVGERRLDHRLAIVLFYAPPKCELEPKVSEELLLFNFHYLLFALSMIASALINIMIYLRPEWSDENIPQLLFVIFVNAVAIFGILEIFYWVTRFAILDY